MVVKIYAPAPSVSSGLNYNEKKVAEGKASVIFSSKISNTSRPMDTFQRYENASIRTEKMSFHASVNPSVTDGMSDEKAKEFVQEWMQKMGYGNQPYVLYKHTDTGRVHYHIVSVRVDENGRKIPDFKERKRSQQIMKSLEMKYGFKVGKSQSAEQKKEINPYQGFDPKSGDYSRQIERIAELALSYHFNSGRQFEVVMESLGVKVGYGKDGNRETMYFIGLDPKTGKNCTAPISVKDISFPDVNAVEARAAECKGKIKTREKERVHNIAMTGLSKCSSEKHYLHYMRKCGVFVKFSKTIDGKIFGVTFVDQHNKCCFKANDVGIRAALYEQARSEKWIAEELKDDRKTDARQETAMDIASSIVDGFAAERSRRNEDEQIMNRGKRGPEL